MGKYAMGSKGKPATAGEIDWSRVRHDIADRLDIAAEYELLGLRFAGPAAAGGWRPCHAIDRPDDRPSAAVKIAPGDPHHGLYKDHGGEGKARGFFDVAKEYGDFDGDFMTCLRHYAAKANVQIGTYQTIGKNIVECYYVYNDAGGNRSYRSVRLIRPDGAKTYTQQAWTGDGWAPKLGDVEPLPYRLPELLAARAADPGVTIYIVEGEKCAERLRAVGLTATTSHGGAKNTEKTWPVFRHHFKGARVVILPDHDKDGQGYAERVGHHLGGVAGEIRVCSLPGLPPKGDVVDWLDAGGTAGGLERLVTASAVWDGRSPLPGAGDGATGLPGALPAVRPGKAARRVAIEDDGEIGESIQGELSKVITTRDVTLKKVRWLMPGMIARGKLTLIAGSVGLGKSLLTFDLAARITTGGLIPGGGGARFDPMDILFFTTEDDHADTIKPRFVAAGGNVDRLHEFAYIREGKINVPFTLNRLDILADVLDRRPQIGGIIFDPIISHLGEGREANRAADVRAAMEPLRLMTEARDITTICIAHPNKTEARNVIDRISGSGALVQLMRSAFMVFADPDEPGRYVLLPVKNNLTREKIGLGYRIEEVRDEAVISWENDTVDMTAQKWIDKKEDGGGPGGFGGRRRRPVKSEAETLDWLRGYLREHGKTDSRIVQAAGDAAGFNPRKIFQLRKQSGDIDATPAYEKGQPAWLWTLRGFERPTNGDIFV